jgi:hypothetical protein
MEISCSMLTAKWLHFKTGTSQTDYHNSRQNMVILFCKYFADIRSEAWLNLFWEYVNGNLFAVYDTDSLNDNNS